MAQWKAAGLILSIIGLLIGWPNDGEARDFRVAMLPAAPDGCNTCHTTGGGTPRNAFGRAVESRVTPGGREVFWGSALARLDSDGDGVFNGQELGDPDGDGVRDPNIRVTHPGNPSSFVIVQQPPTSQNISVVSFTLGNATLAAGVKNAVLPSGPIKAALKFNAPLVFSLNSEGDPEFENVEIISLPPSLLDHATTPEFSSDRTTVSATFTLEAGQTYQLIAGDNNASSLDDLQMYFFGTVALSDATVSGAAVLPEDIGRVQIPEEGVALLLDAEALLEIFAGGEGENTAGKAARKIARLKRAAKKAVTHLQSEGEGEGDGHDPLEEVIAAGVRIASVDRDTLDFQFDYVPDGKYVVVVSLNVQTPEGFVDLIGIQGINPEAESEADIFKDLIVVENGQSVSDLEIYLEEDKEDIFIEDAHVERVDFEGQTFFILGPDLQPVPVNVSEALFYTPEGEVLDIDDFLPGDTISILGEVGSGGIFAFEVIGIQRQTPPKISGTVLNLQFQDGRGRIDLTGPQFSFNANTRVVGPTGQALGVRDLRPGNRLVILAREAEEAGRPPQAIDVRILSVGSPFPSPDRERGLFVGELGQVDFEHGRFELRVSFGFNQDTRLINRNDGVIDLTAIGPGVRVQVTVLPTNVGLPFARTIKVLRGVGEQIPEQITQAVFVTPSGEQPVNRAFGVGVNADMRLRFDVPLTSDMQNLVSVYVYKSGASDENAYVVLTTEVVAGELHVGMTLQPNTFYEVYAVLEDGNDVYGIFTTTEELPALRAVSSSPANGAAGVPTTTTLSVTLNRPISHDDGGVYAWMTVLPTPLSGEIEQEDIEISQDGMTLSVQVELEPNRTYLAVLADAYDTNGFRLDQFYKARFSTGAAVATGKVTGNIILPAGHIFDPVLRNGIGFVGLVPADLDFENLEGDEEDRLGVAFDVTSSGEFSMEGVPAGRYVVGGFVFFDVGGEDGEGIGLVGGYVDQNGDPIIIEVTEGAVVSDIGVKLGSELKLTASNPRPGQAGVGSGRQPIALQFSEPLQAYRGTLALDMRIEPAIQGFDPRRDLRISPNDSRRIEANVNLQPNTDYVLLVLWAQGVSGAELDDVIEIPFTTRTRFAGGSISGTIVLNNGSIAKGKVILGNLNDQNRAAEVTIRRDGTFGFDHVSPGKYGIFVTLSLPDGRQIGGFWDADGNDEPDVIEVKDGSQFANLSVAIPIPVATIPPAPGSGGNNAGASLSFDFDTGSGNGGKVTEQVAAGKSLSVGVYARGVKDLIGYEVVVVYDPEKLALKSVLEQSSAEGANVLKKDGGLSAFIGRVGTGTATLTAAILGPSEKVAPDGDGLLGMLEFEALSFSGETSLTVRSAVMTDLQGVTDSLKSDAKGTMSSVELKIAIGLSGSPSIIAADGKENATITAQILDLNGVLQSADNSTRVSFGTTGGTLSRTSATAVNGVATTALTSSTAGTLTVTASASGALDQTTQVVAQATSTSTGTGPVGPVALDLDLTAGDQSKRQSSTTPKTGDIVEVDLVALSGALDVLGVNVELKFNSSALSFKGFQTKDLFANAVAITVPKDGAVQISIAFLGSKASRDAGSIGTVSFVVESGFRTSTSVVLASGEYGKASGTSKIEIGSGGATVIFGGSTTSKPSPDLDGDGLVGFSDFLIFAGAFGKNSSDPGFQAKADLDGNGSIGFPDFLQFAQAFGKPVGGKRAAKLTGNK